MIPLGSLYQKHSKQEGSKREIIMSTEKMNLTTHNYGKARQVNEIRHTRELEKKRSVEPLLTSLQFSDYNHSIPLSHWYLD